MQKQIREKEEGTLSEYYWTKTEWKKTIEEKLLYEKGICHRIDGGFCGGFFLQKSDVFRLELRLF